MLWIRFVTRRLTSFLWAATVLLILSWASHRMLFPGIFNFTVGIQTLPQINIHARWFKMLRIRFVTRRFVTSFLRVATVLLILSWTSRRRITQNSCHLTVFAFKNYELTLIFWSEEAVANRFPNASNWMSKIKSFASSPSRICSDFWEDIVWTILNSSKWNQTWRNEGV